jgi:hypothetical protein
VDKENEIRINFVTVQRTDEDFVYISDGLDPSHQVVMSAVPNPYNGMPVRFLDDEEDKEPSANETPTNNNAIEVK